MTKTKEVNPCAGEIQEGKIKSETVIDNQKYNNFQNSKRTRWFRLLGEMFFPLAVALLLSWWLTATGRDLAWQRAFFDAESASWARGEGEFWLFLYQFASLPVLVICSVAIGFLVARFRWTSLRAWRRVSWYALSLLLIGPGIITNLWMKGTWGRPRPRDLEEFGGRHLYEPVFGLDFTGDGKSFPCGHATMGFYFLGLFFLLRNRYPRCAWISLALSMGWGMLIGYTRMLQGGHFATDVIWAAGVMWWTAAGLAMLFRFERSVLDPPVPGEEDRQRIPLKAKIAGALALGLLITGVALATPYRAKREISSLNPDSLVADAKGSIRVEKGEVVIVPGEALRITGEAWGHGTPTSEIAERWEEKMEPDGIWRFKYLQRHSGFFTEIHQRLRIEIPWRRMEFLKLDLGPGLTSLRLPETAEPIKIELKLRGTSLEMVVAPGVPVFFESTGGLRVVDERGSVEATADAAGYRLVSVESLHAEVVIRQEKE